MKWLMPVVRIVGASLPFAPSLIQLQAEIDSTAIQQRLLALEDPVSALHPDIRKVSEKLYRKLVETGEAKLRFEPAFYTQYSKPLAILEAERFIVGVQAIGSKYVDGLWVKDPKYFVYLCVLYEEQKKMDELVQVLEDCQTGQWLNGDAIATGLYLPRPVVKAMFQLYEARGLGCCSKEIGAVKYMALA